MVVEFLLLLITYIVIGTLIAVVSRRFGVKTIADYYVAGYRLGGFLASMTYAATTYSAFMMVGLVGLAYVWGSVALGFELTYLIATIAILILVGPYIWRLARERGWISPAEMIGDLYGSSLLSAVISIVYLIALVPYISAQMKGIGEIFNAIGLGYECGVTIAAILVLLWIAIAGIWSVATTDAYQGIWMLSAALATVLWLVLVFLPSEGATLNNVIASLKVTSTGNILGITWPIHVFLGYTTPWIFFALTNPQVVQRLYMPKDTIAYRRMVMYFAVYGLLYTVVVTFIGMVFRGLVVFKGLRDFEKLLINNRDAVTPTMLMHAPTIFAAFVFVSITAAAISTANSIVLTIASTIVRDLYQRLIRRTEADRKSVLVGYAAIVVVTMLALIVALTRPSFIVELSVLSSALLLPLAPITLVGLYKQPRRGAEYVSISLFVPFVLALTYAALNDPKSVFVHTILGIPITAWILILSTIPLLPIIFRKS